MATIKFHDADGNEYDTQIEQGNDPDFDSRPAYDIKDEAIRSIELFINATLEGDDAKATRLVDEIRDLIINTDYADTDASLFLEGAFCNDGDLGLEAVVEQAEAAIEVFRGTLPLNRVSGAAA